VALGVAGDHRHWQRHAEQDPAPAGWQALGRPRRGRHAQQDQAGRAGTQRDPPRRRQAGAHERGDRGGHPDAEREGRLDQEQRQPVQGRGREHEGQQVHAETEEVQRLAPQRDQIHGRATVCARAPDAEGLED
jgi:hypothetical protein